MPINLKTHIQTQSKIMKKRQRKKNNKNVFIPLIPVEMTEEEVKQILKTREWDKSEDRRNMHHSTRDGVRVSDELSQMGIHFYGCSTCRWSYLWLLYSRLFTSNDVCCRYWIFCVCV